MDSITHIVLGAVIGEALAEKKLGKKAMLLGAIAQSLPDIDFVASFWLDTSRDVSAHRGITHSFLFIAVVTALLGWMASRMQRGRTGADMGAAAASGRGFTWGSSRVSGRSMTRGDWYVFFGLQLFIHVFLDAFNAYGTGWFEPFSHYRVSFNALFVADPFYSFWPSISCLALLILARNSQRRRMWVRLGLILSSLYLCYCLINKCTIDRRVKDELERQHIAYTRYFTTPTPLNSWLWFIVAEDTAGYHTGYLSVFDRQEKIRFRSFSRNDSLLTPFRSRADVQSLLHFSQGYYTVEQWKDTLLVFNDLRFGEMKGWEDPRARFVFHYFLRTPDNNKVIVQRGRFAGWSLQTFKAFVRRIRGN
jgi:inner membrane protein